MFVARIAGGSAGVLHGRTVHAKPNREYGSPDDPVILILPHGGIEYYTTVVFTARKCGSLGVVMATGGAACHLATNVREMAAPVALMLCPDALERIPEGVQATLNPATCSLEL